MGDDSIEILAAFTGGILFELDGEGRYLRILSGDSVLLARPPSELIGRHIRDVLGAPGEPFHAICRRVADTGAVETYDYVLDVPAGRRNFRCEARRRIDENGTASVLLLTRDVTDETALQAKLIAAERLAAVGMFAASVAHEVRQPLAFATTSLEVLARELEAVAPTNERATEALAHVRDAISRMAEIASSVGMVATNPSTRPTTTVRAPLDAALDLCASELRGRTHVCVEVDAEVRVRAPQGELCQVLSNVILNAAQAMNPALAAENEIRAYTERDGDMIRIAIRDTGSGIAPDVLERIFDPFFTTKEDGRGTGLGLYLSRRIVERWGGRISVTSKRGTGTTVEIELPIDLSKDRSPAPPPLRDDGKQRLRILVIDDEATFLRSLVLVLEDMHDVTPCSNAKEALELVRKDPFAFDAVLCDLSMPQFDGAAFYEEMKRLGAADRFVLMTGGAYTSRTTAFLANAQCARIEKPFTPDQLDAVLAKVTAKLTRDDAAPRG
jgi:signal transduction histidine kinase